MAGEWTLRHAVLTGPLAGPVLAKARAATSSAISERLPEGWPVPVRTWPPLAGRRSGA